MSPLIRGSNTSASSSPIGLSAIASGTRMRCATGRTGVPRAASRCRPRRWSSARSRGRPTSPGRRPISSLPSISGLPASATPPSPTFERRIACSRTTGRTSARRGRSSASRRSRPAGALATVAHPGQRGRLAVRVGLPARPGANAARRLLPGHDGRGLMQCARGCVVDLPALVAELAAARSSGKHIVLTNGVFDLLHVGHLRYLDQARRERVTCWWWASMLTQACAPSNLAGRWFPRANAPNWWQR